MFEEGEDPTDRKEIFKEISMFRGSFRVILNNTSYILKYPTKKKKTSYVEMFTTCPLNRIKLLDTYPRMPSVRRSLFPG